MLVWPAAGFVEHARRAGATTAELNLEDTPLSSEFDLTPRGRAGELLPRLHELAFG